MPRHLWISDQKKRDAQIEVWTSSKRVPPKYVGPGNTPIAYAKLVKSPEGFNGAALVEKHDGDLDAFAEALIAGDPEIDLEHVGRIVGPSDRVYVKKDGSILYSARALQVVYEPTGEEKGRKDFLDVEATVGPELKQVYSGRLFNTRDVINRFVIGRTLQMRHINGLTYDFLFEIASFLAEKKKMLLLGSGTKGVGPMIFTRNGSPYRGFLEGRVQDKGYKLLLHLSNLELKKVTE